MSANDDFTQDARTIDAHRKNGRRIIDPHRRDGRWVGRGVKLACVCGHTSYATYDDFPGPITEEMHRDADRIHAAHVAQVLTEQKPTDAEIEAGKAVLESAGLSVFDGHLPGFSEHLARKVLIAARDARRDEETAHGRP